LVRSTDRTAEAVRRPEWAHPSAYQGGLLKASTAAKARITVEAHGHFWGHHEQVKARENWPQWPDYNRFSARSTGAPWPGSRSVPRTESALGSALERSEPGLGRQGSLVPLITTLVSPEGWAPFSLRRLCSARETSRAQVRAIPSCPWEPPLEVERLAKPVLLLTSYPVPGGTRCC